MPELNISSKPKKSHNKKKQLTPSAQGGEARQEPVCCYCGATKNLLTFKRTDGKDITICKPFAIMAGYIARNEL